MLPYPVLRMLARPSHVVQPCQVWCRTPDSNRCPAVVLAHLDLRIEVFEVSHQRITPPMPDGSSRTPSTLLTTLDTFSRSLAGTRWPVIA